MLNVDIDMPSTSLLTGSWRVTAWVSSSIFLGGLKVQWHTLSPWFANVEIDVRLLVPCGVLLSPQFQQKRRKLGKDSLRPVDLRVTSRTESDHQSCCPLDGLRVREDRGGAWQRFGTNGPLGLFGAFRHPPAAFELRSGRCRGVLRSRIL
jgi:hypothetical protein